MGDYEDFDGYSTWADAITSFDDLDLQRFHATVFSPGTVEESYQHVYIYVNASGLGIPGQRQRRHRFVRLLPQERGVQLNLRVQDGGGSQLVYTGGEMNSAISSERASYLIALAEEWSASVTPGDDIEPDIHEDIVNLIDDLKEVDLTTIFNPSLDAEEDARIGAINQTVEILRELEALKEDLGEGSSRESFKYLFSKLRWLIEIQKDRIVPFVQLERPVGYAHDEGYPDWVFLKETGDKKVRHPPLFLPEWFRQKDPVEWLFNLVFGLYNADVYPPFFPDAQSIHWRIVAPAGLRLRHVHVPGTRHRFRRWFNPDPRDTKEEVFTSPDRKYFGRTRNESTFYIRLSNEDIKKLDEVYSETGQGGYEGASNESWKPVKLVFKSRESWTTLVLSWLMIISAALAGFQDTGTPLRAGLLTVAASSAIAYVLFTFDKIVLKKMVLPRILLGVTSFLGSTGVLGSWIQDIAQILGLGMG